MQRVVQRLQVRVNLFLHVTRQEAEFLASLHSRTREDDSPDLFVLQRLDSESYSCVCFARTGRSDGKQQIVGLKSFHQFALVDRACEDRFASYAVQDQMVVGDSLGCRAVEQVEDSSLAERTALHANLLATLNIGCEAFDRRIRAGDFESIPSRHHTNLRVLIAQTEDVRIVHAVECCGVDGFVQGNN